MIPNPLTCLPLATPSSPQNQTRTVFIGHISSYDIQNIEYLKIRLNQLGAEKVTLQKKDEMRKCIFLCFKTHLQASEAINKIRLNRQQYFPSSKKLCIEFAYKDFPENKTPLEITISYPYKEYLTTMNKPTISYNPIASQPPSPLDPQIPAFPNTEPLYGVPYPSSRSSSISSSSMGSSSMGSSSMGSSSMGF